MNKENKQRPTVKALSSLKKINELSDELKLNLKIIELKPHEPLFLQGDIGDSLYMLVQGRVEIRRRHDDGQETLIDTLTAGSIVGEMALLNRQGRTASVIAIEHCHLWRLDIEDFLKLSPEDQRRLVDIEGLFVNRWQRLLLSRALDKLFGQLEPETLHVMQEELEWYHLSNGNILFEQGDVSDGMYIVLNGRLRFVARDENGTILASNEVSPGEAIGEYSLVTSELRSATVFAIRQTNLVKITPERFRQFVKQFPDMMERLTRIIVERQQRTMKQTYAVASKSLTITIIPVSSTLDAMKFATQLATAIRPYGTTLALDAQLFDTHTRYEGAAQTPRHSPRNLAVTALFDELEANQDFLLYVADSEPTEWSHRCLGQADRVILLADPAQSNETSTVEQSLSNFEVAVRTELVLWHSPDTVTPKGTAAWLDLRPQLHAHHHIRQEEMGHLSRLARRLTGNGIGLVLSGGAARGFAHLGVHRAIEELGIPIDYIGATSMGAVLGGSMTNYQTNKQLMSESSNFADKKRLFDQTLPFTSLMASHKVTNFTKNHFKEQMIEDSWLPFFCVATNLTTAEPIIYQRGPVWHAVRASLSIPAVFAPVMHKGDMIVDGCVMDNFPAETIARLCESNRIIGVNISPHFEKKRDYDFETGISGWQILWNRLNPFSKKLRSPTLINTVLRTFEINSIRLAKQNEKYVDVLIYPDVKRFPMTAYDRYEAIAQTGYDAAFDRLAAWKAEKLLPHETKS